MNRATVSDRTANPVQPPKFTKMDNSVREYIVSLALKLQGIPYIYGGSSPHTGFDCSGFVIWVLQVFNILPPGDWNADNLDTLFKSASSPKPGDLAFYGTESGSSHVMMYIGGGLVIGASGGGSATTTEAIAKLQNAKVKIKTVKYRKDFLYYLDIESPRNA